MARITRCDVETTGFSDGNRLKGSQNRLEWLMGGSGCPVGWVDGSGEISVVVTWK